MPVEPRVTEGMLTVFAIEARSDMATDESIVFSMLAYICIYMSGQSMIRQENNTSEIGCLHLDPLRIGIFFIYVVFM